MSATPPAASVGPAPVAAGGAAGRSTPDVARAAAHSASIAVAGTAPASARFRFSAAGAAAPSGAGASRDDAPPTAPGRSHPAAPSGRAPAAPGGTPRGGEPRARGRRSRIAHACARAASRARASSSASGRELGLVGGPPLVPAIHSESSACCGVKRCAGSGCSIRASSDVTARGRCSGHITCMPCRSTIA